MSALLLRLRTWWETADRTQRVVTIFGSAFLVLLIGGTFYFASRPKMAMLFGGLSPADAGSIVGEIQKMGVPVEQDLQGNVYVPSSKLAEVQSKIAMTGKLPATGHTGNEELAKLGMMTTPTVERERLKTILEGELARSIEAIEGVGRARVHINLGERSAFASESKPATASVFLQEKNLSAVGPDQARAIAMMVARGTPNLELNNVFVVDSTGRSLFDGTRNEGAGNEANEKLSAEISEAQRRERELQATFDAAFGAGSTVVKVNLAMDFNRETINQTNVTPNKNPIFAETKTETVKDQNGVPQAGAVAGAATNTPGSTDAATNANTADNAYGGTQDRKEFPYNTTQKHTEKAIGDIQRMSIAVLVNKDKIQDAEAVRGFLTNYLAAFPGAKGEITEANFDKTREQEATKSAAAVKSQDQMQQVFSLLPVAALVIVAFIVLRSFAKAAKAQNVMVTALPNGTLVAGQAIVAGGPALSREESEARALVIQEEGERVKAGGLPAGNGSAGFSFAEDEDEDPEIRAIKERLNVPLEQIKKMSADRPEAVAMLLKSWMLDERR
jgi:flagellar M-ring protein FliF